ncbi:MAG: hypothetical protein ABI164_00460, partial [Acidobacteriaceae bacterium]
VGTSATPTDGHSMGRNSPAMLSASATFSAMDRAGSTTSGSLLHVTPNQVTVGVADTGQGWIEVRAERVAGQVTAALTANSAMNHAALTSVLPAMSSYLNEHHQPVQHIHVETGQAAGQNAASSQEQPRDRRQHREDTSTAVVAGTSGINRRERISAPQTLPRTSRDAEAAVQGTKPEASQFSVRV